MTKEKAKQNNDMIRSKRLSIFSGLRKLSSNLPNNDVNLVNKSFSYLP